MNELSTNIWVTTIVGGVIVALISAALIRFFSKKSKNGKDSGMVQENNSEQKNKQVTEIHNIINLAPEINKVIKTEDSSIVRVAHFKETAKILFIDDLELTDKIKSLKKHGWKNVEQMKDAPNVDVVQIRDADVIFVDYRGIGKTSKEQGLAILGALKDRYKKSKWLILYTAHKVPVNAYEKGADSYLQKNSSIYGVENKIIEGLQNLGT